MATDLLMNECGDLDVTNGVVTIVADGDQVKQAWLIAMRTFLGEYFLDSTIGIPYVQRVFTKRQTIRELKQIFSDASLAVPGITQVVAVVVGKIDSVKREVDVAVTAKLDGNVTGVFKFTGKIPLDDCGVDSQPQARVGTPWFWFDPTNIEKTIFNPGGPQLDVTNAFDKLTGLGTSTSMALIGKGAGLANNRTFRTTGSGDHMLSLGYFAPRKTMFDPAPAPYEEKLELFYVLRSLGSNDGAGLLVLNGVDDAAFFVAIAVELAEGPANFHAIVVRLVDAFATDIVLASPAIVIPNGNTAVVSVTIDRQANTDLNVTVYVDGVSQGTQVNVGVPEWQSDGRITMSSNINPGTGVPDDMFDGFSGEAIGYRELLTDGERAAINTTLVSKWKDL